MKNQGHAAMAALLAQQNIPRHLKGYHYLLRIAALSDSGMSITPAMLTLIAEESGSRLYAVRSGLHHIISRLMKCEAARTAIPEHCRGDLYDTLERLVTLARSLDIPQPE